MEPRSPASSVVSRRNHPRPSRSLRVPRMVRPMCSSLCWMISVTCSHRLEFTGLSFAFSGDTRACLPLVQACKGVDLLIHECFPPDAALAAASGLSIERATIALNAANTSSKAARKVFGLVKPRVAGLYHTLLSSQVNQMVFLGLGSHT